MMGRSSLIISLHYLSARTRKVSTPTPKIEPAEVPKIEEETVIVPVIAPLLSLPTATATPLPPPLHFGINTESLNEILERRKQKTKLKAPVTETSLTDASTQGEPVSPAPVPKMDL